MNGNRASRSARLFRIIALVLVFYSLVEVTDCIAVVLMHFGLLANPYPETAFPAFNRMFVSQPIAFLPVFLYFTLLRIVSAVGLFRLRRWAFWTTVLVCTTTIVWVPFLMPFAGFEMLLDGIILFSLLVARFGTQAILPATDQRSVHKSGREG